MPTAGVFCGGGHAILFYQLGIIHNTLEHFSCGSLHLYGASLQGSYGSGTKRNGGAVPSHQKYTALGVQWWVVGWLS